MRLRSTRLTAIANAIRDKFYGAALNMRFDNTTSLDRRVNFSRTTNATLTNSAGLIANAPMNLLTFSEQFDNAAWVKGGATVTANNAAAPNATVTAETLDEGTTSAVHQVSQLATLTARVPYAFSAYFKNVDRRFVILAASTGMNEWASAKFDLVNGTVASSQAAGDGWSVSSTAISNTGNGWYRCTIVFVASATGATVRAGMGSDGTTYTAAERGLEVYTGSNKMVHLWGAQLELGSTATTYNPTTVKNLLGFTENFDNAAWTKSNAFVQTNLVTYSEDFSQTAWGKANITLTPNATASPTGAVTAQQLAATTTAATSVTQDQVVNATSATFTVYAKQGSGATDMNTFIVRNVTTSTNLLNITVNYSTGAVTYIAGSSGASMQDVGNGWWRIQLTMSSGITSGNTLRPYIGSSGAIVPAGQSAFIWGAQLVQGTTPGDYKATYAAAAAVGYPDIYGQPFAQKLVENNQNIVHYAVTGATSAAGVPATVSCYAKAAERSNFTIFIAGGANVGRTFDLANGTLGLPEGTPLDSSITSVGNGWYRCSVTFTTAAGTSPRFYINGLNPYQGDGTSGIYIFGAQLSDSASVDPYVYQPVAAPTSTAYYGPRFDYDASTATITENYGPELITNGDFSNGATGWILNPTGSNVITISGGAVRFQATGADTATLSQTGVTTAGKFYKVEFDVLPGSSGQLKVLPFGTSGEIVFSCTPGRKTFGTTVATSTSFQISRVVGQVADAYIDNITVTEYLGITSTGAAPKGLLIEEQRTNLLTYSEQFDNAAWAKLRVSVTADNTVAPNGTTTADKLVEDTSASSTHQTFRGTVVSVGTPHTFSAYIKAAGRNFVGVRYENSGSTEFYQVNVNLTNGTATTASFGSPTGTSFSVTSAGNDWWRVSITVTTSTNLFTSVFYSQAVQGNNAYTGDGTSGIYVWGAQLEAGSFATSYIPTVASQVTRAADSASMIGNNFARWYTQGVGSLYAESIPIAVGNFRVASFSDGTTANRILVSPLLLGGFCGLFVAASGTTATEIFAGGSVINSLVKQAVAFTVDDFAISAFGATPITDTSGAVPVVNEFRVGAGQAGALSFNGTISRIAFYPRRLANSELQSITA